MRIRIDRDFPKEDYIIGRMYIDGIRLCNTLEPPWLNNARNVSCIPAGVYEVRLTYSSKFKRNLPLLMDVPKRSAIRIHAGNTVADTEGCILVGENYQKGMVLNSRHYEDELVRLIKEAQGRRDAVIIEVR